MTVTTEVKAVLSAENRASPVVRTLIRDLEQLQKTVAGLAKLKINVPQATVQSATATKAAEALTRTEAQAMRALRQRWTFETRMGRQKSAEARDQEQDRRAFESAAVRDLQRRMAFTTRMARQQLAEQRTVENERQRAAADARRADADAQRSLREKIRFSSAMGRQRAAEERRADRERVQQDQRQTREAERSARADERRQRDVRHGLHQGAGRIGDAGREVMAGARTATIYGAIGAGIVAQIASTGLKARSAIDSAEASARMFGGMSREQVETARTGWLNRAAVDNAFKPADALNAWTEVLKAGIPQLAAPDVTKSIMGASAGLDLNVAETTKLVGRLSTLTQDPAKFNSTAIDAMLNGIAVVAKVTAADSHELVSSLRRGAGVLGSSKMSVTDLTAFTGAGISAGMQEGKAGTFMDFLVNDLVNAKNSRGQRGEDFQKAFSLLGLGTSASVSRQASNDTTTLLLKIFERMETMNPEKAGQVATLLGMREWRGEVLQMMKAAPSLRQTVRAVRDPKNSNHLQQARDEKLGTLSGLMRQLRTTGDLALEAIGGGLEGIVRDIGRFFVNFGKTMKLDVIKAHVRTLLDGFIDGLGFANVTEMLERIFGKPGDMDFSKLNSFFRFAQGFGRGVREVVDSLLSIGKAFAGQDASAETLGKITAKLLGFSFALVAVAPFVSVIAGIATALGALAVSALAIGKLIPKIGIGGAAAGTAAGLSGIWATAGHLIAVGFLVKVANEMGILKRPSFDKGIGRGLLEFLDPGLASRIYGDPKPDAEGEWVDPPARVRRQSHNGAFDDRPLIQKASLSSNETIARLERFVSSPVTADAIARKAAAWQGSFARANQVEADLNAGRASTAITPNVRAGALGRGPSVPGWYGGGTGGATGIPDNVPMSAAERNTLGLIMKYESGGQNTMNYVGRSQGLDPTTAKGYTAQGYFQMLNSNWRRIAPKLGINTPNAMASSLEDQTRVALHLLRNGGIQNWSNFNPKLRAALARGEQAPVGGIPNVGGGTSAAGTAGATGGAAGAGDVAGGAHPLEGGRTQVTSPFAMRWHPKKGGMRMHNGLDLKAAPGTGVNAMQGGVVSIDRSGDVTVRHDDGSSTTYRHVVPGVAAGSRVAKGQRIAGIRADDPRSTGPHLHLESRDAQGKFRDPRALLDAIPGAQAKPPAADPVAELVASGWRRPGDALLRPRGDLGLTIPDAAALLHPKADLGTALSPRDAVKNLPARLPSPSEAAGAVPPLRQIQPWTRQDGGAGGQGGGGPGSSTAPTTVNVTNHITAGNQSPQEMASHIQRHVTEAWNYRSHDLEPELT